MYITRVPNRNSPPAVLLRESYREGGKVKNRTLANLSSWPEAKVEALSRALKGLPPAGLDGMVEVTRSLPHGHVAAVLGTIGELGLEQVIDPVRSRQRDLVAAMITAAVIGGPSKLATARGLRAQTAASSLGEVLGLQACDEDDLYQSMDWLLPRQEAIEDALAARHLRDGTLVLYDVSSAAMAGPRRAVIQSSSAGLRSSRMRALVSIPRSPTIATWARANRSFSLATWELTVVGSPVLPLNTSTATGMPSLEVSSP